MKQYYSINEFSKILGISAQTLRNWDNKGKLKPHHISTNGYTNKVKNMIKELIEDDKDIKDNADSQ